MINIRNTNSGIYSFCLIRITALVILSSLFISACGGSSGGSEAEPAGSPETNDSAINVPTDDSVDDLVDDIVSEKASVHTAVESKIVIEAEEADLNGDWELETSKEGYTGSGYVIFRQFDSSETLFPKGTDPIFFRFRPDVTGRHLLDIRLTKEGTDDKHNDAWVRLTDVEALYAETAEWTGAITTYQIDKLQWWKMFRGGDMGANFGWGSGVEVEEDIDGQSVSHDHKILWMDLIEGKTYTLEFSGRSTQYGIDRLHIYHIPDANDSWTINYNELPDPTPIVYENVE